MVGGTLHCMLGACQYWGGLLTSLATGPLITDSLVPRGHPRPMAVRYVWRLPVDHGPVELAERLDPILAPVHTKGLPMLGSPSCISRYIRARPTT